jgi:L-amino acid N-acyltransferase YncA
MIIRKADNNESAAILEMSQKVIEESSMGYLKSKHQNNVRELFQSFLNSGAYYLIAEEDNKLMGWILLGANFDPYSGEVIGYLFDIYVFPECRNSGVAKKLNHEALVRLKQDNYKKVQLCIFSGNHSKALCQQFGFKELMTVFEKSF